MTTSTETCDLLTETYTPLQTLKWWLIEVEVVCLDPPKKHVGFCLRLFFCPAT